MKFFKENHGQNTTMNFQILFLIGSWTSKIQSHAVIKH